MTRSVWLPVLGAFFIFVLVWKAIVVLTGLPPFILPAPETVGQRFLEGWLDGTFWPHFLTTMVEIAIGFIVGTVLALIAGWVAMVGISGGYDTRQLGLGSDEFRADLHAWDQIVAAFLAPV